MNVLLISGTGFIGARVVQQLVQDGHQITVFHRGQTELSVLRGGESGDAQTLPDRRAQDNTRPRLYQAYGCFRRSETCGLASIPFDEKAELRQNLYPYRAYAKSLDELLYNYDKILVERIL
jgi:hypothetical protein